MFNEPELTPSEKKLLDALRHYYIPVPTLMARTGMSAASVRSHIAGLRARLGHGLIESGYGRGYRLTGVPVCPACKRPYKDPEDEPEELQEDPGDEPELSYAERATRSLV